MKNKMITKKLNNYSVITCDNLTISVGPKKQKSILIDKFNFSFGKSKIYAIVGSSGVGKTTLVNHFNGLKRSKQGQIFVKDYLIDGHKRKLRNYKKIRKNVGLVFQFAEYQIFKDTVEKDIMYGPINYYVNKQKAKQLASKYMYLVRLDRNLLKVNPFDLSHGQQRLVAIAGILSIESDVVIFDEPCAGLDPAGQKHINNIIIDLKKQGKTVIIITHNMDNVLELADEVLVLHKQKLYASGNPYSIFTNQQLLKDTELATPHIIDLINKLVNKNKVYLSLLKAQPRNINQLAKLLKKGGY